MVIRNLYVLLFTICYIYVDGQVVFEPGFFIDVNNQKKECLIKNLDWGSTPTSFEYKYSAEDVSTEMLMSNVTSLNVGGNIFTLKTVEIDRSSEQEDKISDVKKPVFNRENLHLQLLLDGKAKLYQYVDKDLVRFFYQIDEEPILQLVYKSYIINGGATGQNQSIRINRQYQQQLIAYLQCGDASKETALKTRYNKKDLTKYFSKYNIFHNGVSTTVDIDVREPIVRFALKGGVNYSNLEGSRPARVFGATLLYYEGKFESHTGLRIEAELECAFPFRNYAWSLIATPNLQSFKGTEVFRIITSLNAGNSTSTVSVDWKALEIPIGIRYSFATSEKFKGYINALYGFSFAMNSILAEESSPDLEIQSRAGALSIGGGILINDKIVIEIRQSLERYFVNSSSWDTGYMVTSVTAGYKF